MNQGKRTVLLGLAMALLIVSVADSIVSGLIAGFAIGLVVMFVSNQSLAEAVGASGIAMVLSFVFIGIVYGTVLSDMFGPYLVLLITLGYIFVGLAGGCTGHYLRNMFKKRT